MGPVTDPYLWLEDVTGADALEHVTSRNRRTLAEFADDAEFARLEQRLRDILDTDARIPYVRRRGQHLYNFWKDAAHPRGLWRRTTLERYRTDDPEWDVVLDLDALAADEEENWVWSGAQVRRPDFDRALIALSRGGADATVIREFDLLRRAFVPASEGGFTVPEAKTDIGWIDADTVYVGTDTGPGSLTTSGYPRRAQRWRRGTPLHDAPVVVEGDPSDVAVSVWFDPTEGHTRTVVSRATGFFDSEVSVLGPDDRPIRIDAPTDASVSLHREWLTIRITTAWTLDGALHPAGTLLVARIVDWIAGDRRVRTVFRPDAHTSLHQVAWTENHLLLVVLEDVRSAVVVVTLHDDADGEGVSTERLTGLPENASVSIVGTDPDDGGDEFFLDVGNYVTPSTLVWGTVQGQREVLRRSPAFFDADGLTVDQFFATSEDGTRVPYFVVHRARPDAGTDDPSETEPAPGPTLLYAYGGFEVSLTPSYSGIVGAAWLERGGTYVVANLRGGGEYGPAWHTDVRVAGRHKVHEDFAAVARDLVDRGITTADRLGARGGSNGGLLMGIALTKYPELFGAIVCQVPLLDMKRYHLLLAGASWMAEYGDPDDPDDWAVISEYSPYQNVRRPGESGPTYPPVLVTTSTRDDRVHPGHARKMAARLEEYGHDVSYYENIEGGHGGAADNAQLAFTSALAFTFLWRMLT